MAINATYHMSVGTKNIVRTFLRQKKDKRGRLFRLTIIIFLVTVLGWFPFSNPHAIGFEIIGPQDAV